MMMNFSTVTGLLRESVTFTGSQKKLGWKGKSLTQWFKSYIAPHLLIETLMPPDPTLKKECIGNHVIGILTNPSNAETALQFAVANEQFYMTECSTTLSPTKIRSPYGNYGLDHSQSERW